MSAQSQVQDGPVHGRLDPAGRLIEADPALAELHSRAGGEEGGPLAVPQIAALARLARRLGVVISRSALAADGDVDLDLWVRVQPAGANVDLAITGWVERPARVAEQGGMSEREADFLRASADWMWVTDERMRLTSLSQGATAALGKAGADFMGKQLTRLFRLDPGEDEEMPLVVAIAEQRPFDNQNATLRSRSKVRYRLSGVPLIDGAGRFTGFKGSATAIASQSASQAAATKQVHAAETAVDASAFGERLDKALREPLDHIIANAQTIGEQPEGPLRIDYASYAKDIAAAGRHLLALVDDLVDLQAIERPDFAPELEALDLADVARRAAGLLSVRAAAKNVGIDRPSDDEAQHAVGEFRRVLQILVNLLTNAIRYSPEGGAVSIETGSGGGLAYVTVADQGKGIGPADQERIFEKFERVDATEAGGTGLGLYIARRLARAMGGDIAVESVPGGGARFTLSLPQRG